MPTYEYACSKCGFCFEKVQSIKEKALAVCPREACPRKPWGRGKVQRRISTGGGLIFKGSGFYATDYRSENYKAAAKKDAAAQTPAKTETKADAPKESKAPASSNPGGSGNSTDATSVAPPGPPKGK
jgi:putative FmdB family regulatory protein